MSPRVCRSSDRAGARYVAVTTPGPRCVPYPQTIVTAVYATTDCRPSEMLADFVRAIPDAAGHRLDPLVLWPWKSAVVTVVIPRATAGEFVLWQPLNIHVQKQRPYVAPWRDPRTDRSVSSSNRAISERPSRSPRRDRSGGVSSVAVAALNNSQNWTAPPMRLISGL